MHEIDRAVKVVCGRHPNSFLDLFYGSNRVVKLVGVEDTQLQIPEHRADKIWRVHDGKKEGCILFEAILQPDRRSFRGINLKNAAVHAALKIPVISVLVYLQKGRYRTFPDSYEHKIGDLLNRHSFVRIKLWEHEERIRNGELKELAPFLPLFYDDPPVEVLEAVDTLIEAFEDEEQRTELKGVAAIVASRKFAKGLILQTLKLELSMIREKTIFSEWFDKAHEEGHAEGHAEGRTEGLVLGEIRGKHLLLQKLLEKKYGTLPAELKIAVLRLNSEDSDALAMDLYDLDNLGQLAEWFQKRQMHNGANAETV
jgi:hypothetical protein